MLNIITIHQDILAKTVTKSTKLELFWSNILKNAVVQDMMIQIGLEDVFSSEKVLLQANFCEMQHFYKVDMYSLFCQLATSISKYFF